nr:hypothetical protein CFP56_07002 [Quercus suber]
MYLNNCTSLRSLPKLPVDIVEIWGYGCTSLEMVPDLQKSNSFFKGELYLSNCSKLADNQDFIDNFLAMIRKHHQGFSRHGRYDIMGFNWRYDMIIPGSVIPKWFIHQDHIYLCYLLPQYYKEEDIKLLNECEANELSQIGIKIETKDSGMEVKKCGFRMVYKKDIEDLN